LYINSLFFSVFLSQFFYTGVLHWGFTLGLWRHATPFNNQASPKRQLSGSTRYLPTLLFSALLPHSASRVHYATTNQRIASHHHQPISAPRLLSREYKNDAPGVDDSFAFPTRCGTDPGDSPCHDPRQECPARQELPSRIDLIPSVLALSAPNQSILRPPVLPRPTEELPHPSLSLSRSLRRHGRLADRARGGDHLGKRSITADAPASPCPSTPRRPSPRPRRRDSPSGAKQPKDAGYARRTKDKFLTARWRYSLLCLSLTAAKSSFTTNSAALAGFH